MTTKKKTVLPDRYLRAYQEGMVGPYGEENVRAVNKKKDLLEALQNLDGFLICDYETIVDVLLQYISDTEISAAVQDLQDRC